jgi:Coenzyme PQQ synthesis protein D (PqqD)
VTSLGPAFRRRSTTLFRTVGDQVILTSQERRTFDILNGSACAVWTLLERPRSLGDLVATLASSFRGKPEVIEQDLITLIGEMTDRGWVEVVDASARR